MNKAVGIVLLALLMHLGVVNGLKCYGCFSTKDWSKCTDIEKEVTCASSISHCLKAEVTATTGGVEVSTYMKLCSDDCDTKSLSKCNIKKEGVTYKCSINCCTGDLCNGGSVPLISGAIIIACALLNAMFALI